MALQAKQTIQQRLMLAPNVTLALEILRMPTMELRAFLEHQLEENPLLELDESDAQEQEAQEASNGTEEAPDSPGLDEEWLSHWRTGAEREEPDEEDGADDRFRDQRLATAESLHESLLRQLGCQRLPEESRRLGEAMIPHLNEHGYIETPLEELAAQTGASLEQVGAALRLIQRMDPPGVGARDLRECLMLQLEQADASDSLAYHILTDHFQLFVSNRLGALARAIGASAEQVARACAQLKRLDPRPGRAFAGTLPPAVVPDLIIRHQEQHYDVELNDQEIPRVSVSRAYYRMLKDPRTPSDAKEFLANTFRKTAWLIKAIDERNATLLSIARCLISLQCDFLMHGPRALKPLTQSQVAGLIGRHPSTVSRAISGKTIDTPCGVFRLEDFFASGVPQTDETDSVSDATIKAEIRCLIAEEVPQAPLSDAELALRLAQRNISVARRTIAKYRTALKILPAHLRKYR